MLNVINLIESPRLCGYRKRGQFYLKLQKANFQCCKLPFKLNDTHIPTAVLSILPGELRQYPETIKDVPTKDCISNCCPMLLPVPGFMWINEKDYEFAAYWFTEARISPMYINAGAVVNRTDLLNKYILIAHRKAIVDYSDGPQAWVNSETGQAYTNVKYFPGIFAMAQVVDIEYVIGDRHPDSKMKQFYHRLQNEGHSLVNLIQEDEIKENSFDETLKFAR